MEVKEIKTTVIETLSGFTENLTAIQGTVDSRYLDFGYLE